MPAEEARATGKQATEDVRVKSGQTLYQISLNKLGKYDGKVLEQLRGLNPTLQQSRSYSHRPENSYSSNSNIIHRRAARGPAVPKR